MSKAILVANELYNEYKTINSEVYFINRGGCGVFAEILYYTLQKFGLEPKLGVITKNPKGMIERINAWKHHSEAVAESVYVVNYGHACIDHIVILIDNIIIDSEGIYTHHKEINNGRYKYDRIVDNLNINILRLWNNNGNFWNDAFNRDNIKTIEKKLEDSYKKVNKNLVVSK